VPETVVEGEIELGDALFLDSVADGRALRKAHERGHGVAVRAASAEEVRAALARPEVACALVPAGRRDLLELDLTELTSG
jgi:hypothetical protein